MPSTPSSAAQLALDEQAIEDDEILTALESYQNARDEAKAASAVAKEEKVAALTLLDKLEVPEDGAIRIGRFRITRKTTPARTVEFTTEAKERIGIALVVEDD